MTILRSILFLILVPGVIVGVIPVLFLFTGPYMDIWFLSYLAFPLWMLGGAVLIWCFWDFVRNGHGTPAPIDPPKELVVSGLYRYVRNPMYVGVLMMLFSYFLWLGYWYLLAYAGVFFLATNTFVKMYEEPTLKRKFGRVYEKYLRDVPRWVPKFRK